MPWNDDQRRALGPLLDGYIPRSADGTLPGAGELGIAADLDAALQRVPAMHAMWIGRWRRSIASRRLAAHRGSRRSRRSSRRR